MENIWTVLGLEPTRDVSAIKRAYAERAKICHPEEDPQGFLRLRNAYQAALDYAEGETDLPRDNLETSGEAEVEEPEEEDEGWSLTGPEKPLNEGPNPYEDHEAICGFLELYTGKQRKDAKRWLDYFTSDAFLDVARERRFAALLLEHVARLETEYPVNREFLNWLCVAYRFNVIRAEYRNPDSSERVEYSFQIDQGAQFDGQEFVFEIATKGPAPKHPKGNELAMWHSFREYGYLCAIAENNAWSEREIGQFSQIIGCYAAGYITDKCQQRGDMDHERHPAGMRLMTHFLRRGGLPEELYRIAWEKLDLKTALMGRAQILYGAMRELALERVPELSGAQRMNLAKLREDLRNYFVSTHKRKGEDARATEEDIQRTDAFFAREDFQRALLDRRFVEEEMLHTAVSEARCDYYLKKVIRFYETHETAPCAQQVIDRAKQMLKYQALADRLRTDREAEASEDGATLRSAPFFRHWINTAFFHAQDRASGQGLIAYLTRELPFLPEWSREFLGYEEGGDIRPVLVTREVGGDLIEVRFHLRYMEFFRNLEQMYRPCLPWERVAAVEDTDTFFFLLPITVEAYDQYERVRTEVLRRLENTAAPEDGREIIAGCLADHVCALPLPDAVGLAPEFDGDEEPLVDVESLPPESYLPFEVFAEDGDSLYVCVWFQREQVLAIYQQTPYGKQAVKGEQYDGVADEESALALARQFLQEKLFPTSLPMQALETLPDAVYAQWDYTVISRESREKNTELPPGWSAPVKLLGAEVASERLDALLTQFQEGRVQRLELSWKAAIPVGEEQGYEPRRSLVFLKDGGRYACLYFDDFTAKSYALLEKPELYGKGNNRPEPVPFLRGKLFSQVVHHTFRTIRRHLDVIFRQISWPSNAKPMEGKLWTPAEYVSHGRVKYNLDKQLLADFPLERAHNRLDAPFYFSRHPDSAALADGQGGMDVLVVHEGNRLLLQQMLARFFREDLSKLRMTWGKEPGCRRHIVLLQENGRFLMAWVREKEKMVRFHVADWRTYADVEGKKYPKDTFQDRVVPAYLLHDKILLRNALDLLLANLGNPGVVTDRIAEYAEEKPIKARPYEALWTELVGNTLK